MKLLVLIALAGALGTLARYGSVKLVNAILPGSCWATLMVNIVGACIAGFAFILCKEKFSDFEAWFPILFIGFLGAFTTFSTFALESVRFLTEAQYCKFALNIILHTVCGLGAAAGGMYLAKLVFKG